MLDGRSELHLWAGPLGFRDCKDLVYGGNRDFLVGAIGPEDFELVDSGGGAQAEVDPGIGTGGVAATGKNVGSLPDAAGVEEGLGADGVAGRLEGGHWRRRLCDQFQTEPVVGGLAYIAEKGGSGIDVV